MTAYKSFTCALLATLTLTLVGHAADEPRVLTRVAEIRALSREEAAKALPVRLRAVVIWQSASRNGAFFVHDGQFSIYVNSYRAISKKLWQGGKLSREDYSPGSLIELECITDPGGYAPCVVPVRFHRVGTEPLPAARRVTLPSLSSGVEDGQRVEVTGVVQDVSPPDSQGRSCVLLMSEGYPCQVFIEKGKGLDAGRLVDASVRVRGCSSPVFNLRSEPISIRLKAQDAADIDIDRPAPADPFMTTRVALQALLQFSLNPESHHRKVTQGTVNFVLPGRFFFIQEGSTGVRVESSDDTVQAGDRVEVAAFIDTSRTLASLQGALVRKLGKDTLPPPLPVAVEEILHPSQSDFWNHRFGGDYSGRVVRISGSIQKLERGAAGDVHTLLIRSGNEIFRAYLPYAAASAVPVWEEGSEVELAGVCELDFISSQLHRNLSPSTLIGDLPEVSGFNLWLRSPADVRVLSVPSWWTPFRLGITLLGTALVLGLALGWVGFLRREVQRQTTIIEGKIAQEVLLDERQRMARELHDTLEQHLTGVRMQIETADEDFDVSPEDARASLQSAAAMLAFSHEEARRSVWNLRHPMLLKDGLAAAIQTMFAGHAESPCITVTTKGSPVRLSITSEFHLLRVAQEAVTNALKHASASNIDVIFDWSDDSLVLTFRDDGRGFETAPQTAAATYDAAHFGLMGMQERIGKIGGTLTIQSEPGQGTSIIVSAPITKDQKQP